MFIAHLYPATYRAVMERLGGDTTHWPLGSDATEELDGRFRMMDGAQVDVQVLSFSSLPQSSSAGRFRRQRFDGKSPHIVRGQGSAANRQGS